MNSPHQFYTLAPTPFLRFQESQSIKVTFENTQIQSQDKLIYNDQARNEDILNDEFTPFSVGIWII